MSETKFRDGNYRLDYLKAIWGEVLTPDEATEKYEVLGFAGGLVTVVRRADGVKGSLNFTSTSPRYYFDFHVSREA